MLFLSEKMVVITTGLLPSVRKRKTVRRALFDKFAKLIMGAVDDTAKVFLLSLKSVLVKERRRV